MSSCSSNGKLSYYAESLILMVFASGDSIKDGSVALCTPHTSFADPTTPPDAPYRESIELRALVFYDD